MARSPTCLVFARDQPGAVGPGGNHQAQGPFPGIRPGAPGGQPAVFPTWGPGSLGAHEG